MTSDRTATPNTLPGTIPEGQIGIFWVHQQRLMPLPVVLSQAERRETKLDSPDAHVDAWPRVVARYRRECPVLEILEYDEVPRGRILFETRTHTFMVYMDARLFVDATPEHGPLPEIRAALQAAFGLTGKRLRFGADPHYDAGPWPDDEDAETDW
jgi:hypothetical protein